MRRFVWAVMAMTLVGIVAACGDPFQRGSHDPTGATGAGGGGASSSSSSTGAAGGGTGGGGACGPLNQTPGDCKSLACDGGNAVSHVDDNDVPDDQNPCTDDACTDGAPSHTPVAVDTSCGGELKCDGSGNCVGCVTASDCPGSDNECRARACSDVGVCGFDYVAAGTTIASQTPGDCQIVQCDGNGNAVSHVDDNDVPDDQNPCTDDVCAGGVPSHAPVAVNTACGGELKCDGNGNCVGCVTAANCPGSDGACATRTCNAGVCGFDYVAAGTTIANQTPGDCQIVQCDGNGNAVSHVDDTDVQVDGNQCTDDQCNAGVPIFPPLPKKTPCVQNGGAQCDAYGVCMPLDPCGVVIPSQGDAFCFEYGILPGALGYQNGMNVGLSGSFVPPGGSYALKDPLFFDGAICENGPVPNVTTVHCEMAAPATGTVGYFRLAQHAPGVGAISGTYACTPTACGGNVTVYAQGVVLGWMHGNGMSPVTLSGPVSLTQRKESRVTMTGADLGEVTVAFPPPPP